MSAPPRAPKKPTEDAPDSGSRSVVQSLVDRTGSPLALGLTVVLLVVFVAGAIDTDNFLTASNIRSVLRTSAYVGILATGLTFVTISGNFFLLSLNEMAMVASVSFVTFIAMGFGFVGSLLAVMVIAGLIGALQGMIVGFGGNPIVVTLGAAGVLFGVASAFSNNEVLPMTRPHPAEWLGSGLLAGVPAITWTFLLVVIAGDLVLRHSRFGRTVTLIGANKEAGKLIGLHPLRTSISVFAISSCAGALVGIMVSSQLSQGGVELFADAVGPGGDLTIGAIAAVMVGGTAIHGGEGSVLRSALGAVFIAAINNMMVLRGFTNGPRLLFVGMAVVLGVTVYALSRRGQS
jgi:ribose transport system permease protein